MSELPFFPAAYGRTDEGFGETRLINYYFERTPQGPGSATLIPRPPLAFNSTVGSGPIRAMLKVQGVLSGDLITVSGDEVYQGTTLAGTLTTSDGDCFMAASDVGVVVVDVVAGLAYYWTGAWTPITDPDLPVVASVAFFLGRWYFGGKDSSIFYWSAIGDPTTIDGLAFSTAEASPDKILQIVRLGDDLGFVGPDSIEFWYGTGDVDQPVQRYNNRTYSQGSLSAASILQTDNTFFFLSSTRLPCRAESVPRPLIDPQTGSGYAVAERLRKVADEDLFAVRAWAAKWDGHDFVVWRIPGQGSFAYDLSTGQWCEWQTHGADQFVINVSVVGADVFMGSDTDGTIYQFTMSSGVDYPNLPIDRIASAYVSVLDGVQRCDAIGLVVRTPNDLDVSLRYSDTDWSDWLDATTAGGIATWRRLGLMRPPGRSFEIMTSDSVIASLITLKLNPVRF